jgi:5,10-methylenetetrahydromethanopterin reductase
VPARTVELWRFAFPIAGRTARLAAAAEAAGWDGFAVADSQHLVADPYVELALAAQATTRLRLSTAATNLVTRDPAVTASSILTVHAESGGRAVLGVARGDSALGFLGRSPMPLTEFATALEQVRAYLRGEPVERRGHRAAVSWPASLGLPPVPLDVHATGPKVIAAAARVADRLTVAVGAQPDWIHWAMTTARRTRAAAGLDPATLRIGALVVAAALPDPSRAADLVRGNVAIFAHIAGRDRAVPDVVPGPQRAVIDQVVRGHAEAEHGTSTAQAARELPDDFVHWFAAAGTAEHVADRLSRLIAAGLDHLLVVGPSRDASSDDSREALAAFDEDVLPRLRPA